MTALDFHIPLDEALGDRLDELGRNVFFPTNRNLAVDSRKAFQIACL